MAEINKNDINTIKKEITTYEQAVDYLLSIPKFTSKNTMEDTKAFLKLLGNPDENMKIIHVAGTNGKGSVCAYLRAVLEEAGYSTCVFTSPHLVDVRERFLIRGKLPEKQEFFDAFMTVFQMIDFETFEKGEGYHPTFFEYMFFIAMILFEKADTDYCILETGLGGRLDATNAVSKKELSVITRISLEHVEYLGDTLEKIAGEKAGIIQENAPVVYTDAAPSVAEVFCKKASICGVSAYGVSKDDYEFLNFKNKNIDFSLHTEYYGYIRLTLRTQARYQMENASLAVRALEVLDRGRNISCENIIQGVSKCFWQGRMEEVLSEIYVDGAHNADGLRAFLESVSEDGWTGERTLLFGVVKDKDYESMISQFVKSGLFREINVAPLKTSRRLEIGDLQAAVEKALRAEYALHSENDIFPDNARIKCYVFENVESAMKKLTADRKVTNRIYIAGSLYLVGEVKEFVKTIK